MDEINQWLLDVHCIEHKAMARVFIDNDFYTIAFDLNNSVMPYHISGEFDSQEAFVSYVKKQLREIVHTIKYYKIQMMDNTLDETCDIQNTTK